MDKLKLLQDRKSALAAGSGAIRADVAAMTDEGSFVELSAFSFSKNAFYEEDACGEAVVTGFATVNGYPFYIVAQNFEVLSGGLSKANCEKIARTLDSAEKNETPVIYLLHSHGVQIGEGVNVMEGVAKLLLKATQLKGTVPQYAVVNGEVYGSAVALAAVCDCVFFFEKSALCVNSPLVLSAKAGKNLKAEEVGGYRALSRTGIPAVAVKDVKEASALIAKLTELVSVPVVDADLNGAVPALNERVTAEAIAAIVEDGVEIGANTSPEVKTVLGRVGGISVAAVIFDRVCLNALNVKKIKNFAEFACCYGLPFVTFVDCVGIKATMDVNDSSVLKEITEYLSILDAIDTAKIAVVTGSAVGLGYSLFAAKSVGFDYTYALATSKIALFEETAGAEIEFANEKNADKEKLRALYAEENSDPVNAAKGGYLDNLVEPQFLRQYLIASLQMLIK
ncbi:MAG: carboxyl transferase domain-containing protein [Candidatus Gallimonas sp.]